MYLTNLKTNAMPRFLGLDTWSLMMDSRLVPNGIPPIFNISMWSSYTMIFTGTICP